jgi:hypothetical protein
MTVERSNVVLVAGSRTRWLPVLFALTHLWFKVTIRMTVVLVFSPVQNSTDLCNIWTFVSVEYDSLDTEFRFFGFISAVFSVYSCNPFEVSMNLM